ncbi:hypothetical protein ACRRTK_002988 [Alexandromys fortis]
MERTTQSADSGGGGGSNSSSRSSSRATSAGSSPSCSLSGRGVAGRSAAAGLGGGGSRSSPGSVAASPSGGGGRRREPALEGVLSKYTNLLQGWQNRTRVTTLSTNSDNQGQSFSSQLSLGGNFITLTNAGLPPPPEELAADSLGPKGTMVTVTSGVTCDLDSSVLVADCILPFLDRRLQIGDGERSHPSFILAGLLPNDGLH